MSVLSYKMFFTTNRFMRAMLVLSLSGVLIFPMNSLGRNTFLFLPRIAELDSFFDSVALLLQGEGTSGSTAITASGYAGPLLTNSGVTNSNVAKMGAGSLSFSGTNFLTSTSTESLNAAFTFETWIYLTGNQNHPLLITGTAGYGTRVEGFGIFSAKNFGLAYIVQTQGYTDTGAFYTGVYPALNQWHHIAITRDASNTWRFFINGALVPHYVDNQYWLGNAMGVPSVTADISLSKRIGNCQSTGSGSVIAPCQQSLRGYLDNLRITKGIARYTKSFNLPSGDFPAQTRGVLQVASGSSANFGDVYVGRTGSRAFTFANIGNTRVSSVMASVTPGKGLTISNNSCGTSASPGTLDVGVTCQMTVQYNPSATGALTAASIQVISSALNSPSNQALSGAGVPDVDPQFANVPFLLQGEGTSGSTSITASGYAASNLTNSGVTISNVAKMDTGSLSFSGTNFLTSTSTESLNAAFTFETWIYLTGNQNHPLLITGTAGYGTRVEGFGIFSAKNFGLAYIVQTQGYTDTGAFYTGVYPALNQWHHIAITRDASNTWRFFINGALVPHYVDNQYWNGYAMGVPSVTADISLSKRIGNCQSTGTGSVIAPCQQSLRGYLDDLRITKGVARYTSSFTVPEFPFPPR